ncbi:GerAB/ArcD/ProY family transporter [Paenibacillus flagellatus]|uniref:Uncharacterized protein n=1 Tax=Paenibacillus flagellatus TaxID=2211139 RepID=A0A2V5K3Y2_9BACL|nr:endospore germination permease [Paenibacillus flagellatus]PYI52584.1 hypothetical protein DLM86_20645 [Paenibacillus flagellatus]
MKERISGYQLFMLAAVLYINGGMISMFKTLAEVSRQDAWFNFIFSMLYAILIAYLMYRLSVAYPGRNLFDICEEVCGRRFGKLLNALLLVYTLHLLTRDLRMFGDFIGTAVLQRTPTEFIYLSSMLVLIYFATGSMEEFVRSVNVIFPIFVVNLLLLPLLLSNEIEYRNLQPFLSQGPADIVKAGLLGTGWSGDVIVFGAFLNYFRHAKQFYVSLKLGIVASALVLTVLMLLSVSVLGTVTVARAMYPVYTLTEQINITDFLDRLDVLLIGFWMPAFLMKIITIYFCFLAGVSSMLKTGHMRGINVMSGWFILLLTLLSFKSVMEVYRFGNYGSLPVTLFVHVIFFGCVLTAFAWKRRGKRAGGDRASEGSGASEIGWRAATCIALAALFAGSYTGHWYKAYGMAGAAVYAAAFVAIVAFSVAQFWSWNRIVRPPAGP